MKSYNFCYCKAGRAIIEWGAIEKSLKLLSQYQKYRQFESAPKISLAAPILFSTTTVHRFSEGNKIKGLLSGLTSKSKTQAILIRVLLTLDIKDKSLYPFHPNNLNFMCVRNKDHKGWSLDYRYIGTLGFFKNVSSSTSHKKTLKL